MPWITPSGLQLRDGGEGGGAGDGEAEDGQLPDPAGDEERAQIALRLWTEEKDEAAESGGERRASSVWSWPSNSRALRRPRHRGLPQLGDGAPASGAKEQHGATVGGRHPAELGAKALVVGVISLLAALPGEAIDLLSTWRRPASCGERPRWRRARVDPGGGGSGSGRKRWGHGPEKEEAGGCGRSQRRRAGGDGGAEWTGVMRGWRREEVGCGTESFEDCQRGLEATLQIGMG